MRRTLIEQMACGRMTSHFLVARTEPAKKFPTQPFHDFRRSVSSAPIIFPDYGAMIDWLAIDLDDAAMIAFDQWASSVGLGEDGEMIGVTCEEQNDPWVLSTDVVAGGDMVTLVRCQRI